VSASGAVLSLALSVAILLSGALLFTNGIEWLGSKIELGQGAVGSVLAAVATALPETLIPIVAIVGGAAGSEQVATGAILGAPFMLSTLAMVVVGGAVLIYRRRRPQGIRLEVQHLTLARDLGFFIACFAAGWGLGVANAPLPLRIVAAIALVVAYLGYVRRTLADSGEVEAEETLAPLAFDRTKGDPPGTASVVIQCVAGLGAIVVGADIFVEAVTEVADDAGVEPIVLSLVIAPIATELPEQLNSFLWARQGKDALALGNITGAMVFQSTVALAFGLAFTDWTLDANSIVVGVLALAGAALAIFELQIRRRFVGRAVAVWALLYASFVAYAFATA
jgi:cation:H+ antiporter